MQIDHCRLISLRYLCCYTGMAVLLLAVPLTGRVFAQESRESETGRALELIRDNKFEAALPILEKLHLAHPDDHEVIEALAYSLAVRASVEKDAGIRRKGLQRARQLAERASALGRKTPLLDVLLERLPADGNSQNEAPAKEPTPAEAALFEGEEAFAKGEMERAIELYEKASRLDPRLYDAPLFIGDCYFKLKQIDRAGAAYLRAIAVNPDRETAYRYWGNVLMSVGRMEEARDKFIEAIIVEPYNRAPWEFLIRWAERNQVKLGHPRLEIPKESVKRNDDNSLNITISPTGKNDGSDAWMIYSIIRGSWQTEEKIAKEFPTSKRYRHSLREEVQALQLTAESVETQLKEKKLKEPSLDISIANLLKLHRAGMLEPFVLYATPDDGIAEDYPAYRRENRDKLRRYLLDYVILNK